MRLTDLPPAYQRQALAQLVQSTVAQTAKATPRTPRRSRQPSKTEIAYLNTVLARRSEMVACLYEGATLRLPCGHAYTPDFVVFLADGAIEMHEVKGAYKLPSERSAKWAFDSCREYWRAFTFVWARANRNGGFDVRVCDEKRIEPTQEAE
jgi:hypothetical protein